MEVTWKGTGRGRRKGHCSYDVLDERRINIKRKRLPMSSSQHSFLNKSVFLSYFYHPQSFKYQTSDLFFSRIPNNAKLCHILAIEEL